MLIKIKKCCDHAIVPRYAHADDAGMDLCAACDMVIAAGEWARVPTGIAIELPQGTEAQVRPRSGLAAKYGVTMLNSPGTIDAGYRGEVCVLMINHGKAPFEIHTGDRIAQLVIAQYVHAELEVCDELSDTQRGMGGFGSTGK